MTEVIFPSFILKNLRVLCDISILNLWLFLDSSAINLYIDFFQKIGFHQKEEIFNSHMIPFVSKSINWNSLKRPKKD